MMFTPLIRKRGWSGWSASPKVCSGQGTGSKEPRENSTGVFTDKNMGVTAMEATTVPHPQLLVADNDNEAPGGSGVSKDSGTLKEFELLDERDLLRKDNEALSKRYCALECERDECLYNMGILLIEKKDLSPKIEELKQALLESQEYLKREHEAHNIVLSELENHEQDLKKALGVEKQCVVDLEKALHEMRVEIAETKFTSEKKLADAHALEAHLEEKKMEIEAKLHAADARLAECNRKNSEMTRKLEDLEAREYKLQRELTTLSIERKTLEEDVSKQRAHLCEWENELQENQRRLLNEQRLLNEREERANEMDKILKKKQEEIAEARKKVDSACTVLKSQEDDFKVRLRALTVKERDVEIMSSNLEKKEKDLITIEEKLCARESEEIQKLLNEHNVILDAKKREFELEMVKERSSFDEEVKNHRDMLDREKGKIQFKEEQIIKREKAIEDKIDKLKTEEKDHDTKSKALKKWEDSLKTDEKKLQEERKQLLKNSSELEDSRDKLHNEKVALEAEVQKVVLEKENLKIAQEERDNHLKLQVELKLEKKEYQMMLESLEKEKEVLRKEKENFERDWEVLDEKRVALEFEVKQLSTEREKFEKWRHNEMEKLKNEGLEVRTDMQSELEDLSLKKEAFEKMMDQDRADVRAEVDRKCADMTREFELLKHELEMDVQRRQDDAEKKLKEKEHEFEKWREVELNYIKSSSESNDFKLRRLEMQQNQLQREKEELSDERRKLESARQEVQNDIDTLLRLSKSLKGQREGFVKEKEMFLSVVEQCKSCHNCGVPINKIDLDLLPLRTAEYSEEILVRSLADGFLKEHIKARSTVTTPGGPVVGSTTSNSHMTRWFQRCASLFKISPQKNAQSPTVNHSDPPFIDRLDRAASEDDANYQPAPSADHYFENQPDLVSGNGVGEPDRVDKTGDETEASFDVDDNSVDIIRIHRDNIVKKALVATDDENNEMQGSSMHTENDSQPEPSKQERRLQPTRKAKHKLIRRTRSVKAVVEDAKAILGENYELKLEEQQNGNANESQNIPKESQGVTARAGQALTGKRRKRHPIELEPEGSEAHSESASLGGLSKRRNSSSLPSTPGDKRYNLRRSTVANTSPASRATSHQKEDVDAERISFNHPQPSGAFESSVNLPEDSAAVIPNVPEVDSENIVQNDVSEQSAGDGNEVDGGDLSADNEISANDDGSAGGGDDDDDDEEERTASVGKKIWHFLTT